MADESSMDEERSYDGSAGPWRGRGYDGQQNATMKSIAQSLLTVFPSLQLYELHNDEG